MNPSTPRHMLGRAISGGQIGDGIHFIEGTEKVYSSHRLVEARSLAMHAVIARKIERDPGLLQIAVGNLERWSAKWETPPRWLEEWREILDQPWQYVAAIITEPNENAARLRQSSPFAGILTHQERWRIYKAFRT